MTGARMAGSFEPPVLDERPSARSRIIHALRAALVGALLESQMLAEQLARDKVEVPPVMLKCCHAIEKYGMYSQGIYRVSGMTSKVAALKSKLDKGKRFVCTSFAKLLSNLVARF